MLAVLGDSITTDHISPAGSIKGDSPAGKYLTRTTCGESGLQYLRRAPRQSPGNDARNLRQHATEEQAGSRRKKARSPVHLPDGKETTIFEAAEQYRQEKVPVMILAGKEYGSGSSRDWAAKGSAACSACGR